MIYKVFSYLSSSMILSDEQQRVGSFIVYFQMGTFQASVFKCKYSVSVKLKGHGAFMKYFQYLLQFLKLWLLLSLSNLQVSNIFNFSTITSFYKLSNHTKAWSPQDGEPCTDAHFFSFFFFSDAKSTGKEFYFVENNYSWKLAEKHEASISMKRLITAEVGLIKLLMLKCTFFSEKRCDPCSHGLKRSIRTQCMNS